MEQQIILGLITVAGMALVGFVCYWTGQKDGYWAGFCDATRLAKYTKRGEE